MECTAVVTVDQRRNAPEQLLHVQLEHVNVARMMNAHQKNFVLLYKYDSEKCVSDCQYLDIHILGYIISKFYRNYCFMISKML